MNFTAHSAVAWRPAAIHAAASACVLLLAAVLVFGVWYPSPLDRLADGRSILFILMGVDLICGPMLTFLVASPGKSRVAFWGDVIVIGLLQLVALAYGVNSLYEARPVHLAFEGNRFRVVSVPDIDPTSRPSPDWLRQGLPQWGPEPIGVKISEPGDPDFLSSLQQSLNGNHPAFRPERWVPYQSQVQLIKLAARPAADLVAQSEHARTTVNDWLASHGKASTQVVYLPLENEKREDWIVLLDALTLQPLGYLALDGWL